MLRAGGDLNTARAAMDGAAAGEMGEAGEAGEAGERGIALEERADDDAASVLTHPLEGEPCDKPFVRTPHLRLATLGPSLRGPLLMHALANCFGDVISHLSTNSRGGRLSLIPGGQRSRSGARRGGARATQGRSDLQSGALSAHTIGPPPTELAKEAKAIEVTC